MSRNDRFAIATLSLGSCELHSLEDKLRAASHAGFAAVELFVADWEKYLEGYLADRHLLSAPENHHAAARDLKALLDQLHLRVNCLQPLRGIEGIVNPAKRAAAFEAYRAFLPICNILHIDLILCCSSIEPDVSPDVEVVSRDLVELADTAATWQQEHGGRLIRIGYEALSWGTHVNKWRDAWARVSYEPRPNLGMIIDSFNSLAREYADPYTPSGLQRSTSASASFLARHLADLVATIPGEKIFLFQIADAGLPAPSSPLSTPPPHDSGIPRLQPWSRNCRLFPMETQRGAFLPVAQYAKAVLATGYTGDLSLEVFNASLGDKGSQVPVEHAARGYTALTKLDKALQAEALPFPKHLGHADLLTSKLHQALGVDSGRVAVA